MLSMRPGKRFWVEKHENGQYELANSREERNYRGMIFISYYTTTENNEAPKIYNWKNSGEN